MNRKNFQYKRTAKLYNVLEPKGFRNVICYNINKTHFTTTILYNILNIEGFRNTIFVKIQRIHLFYQ